MRDAALVIEDGSRASRSSRPAPAADERIDAAGRCVIPGFVDSHTHLVFAGDRADEFVARMAGRPYAAGGIAVTVGATRAADDDELREPGLGAAARGVGRAGPPTSRSSRATASTSSTSTGASRWRRASPTT